MGDRDCTQLRFLFSMFERVEYIQRISQTTGFVFDEKKLKTMISKYTRLPRMLTVEGICRINGVKYEDRKESVAFVMQGGKTISLPKDHYSDAYRVQQMIEAQTFGGEGMIYLPSISGVMEGKTVEEKWNFKTLWDERKTDITYCLWGGSFLTNSNDYVDHNTGQFKALCMDEPYYYNVAMPIRDRDAFEKRNPRFEFSDCTDDCLGNPFPHYHAVAGCYEGAKVGGVDCAPPAMCLTGEAEKFPDLNPTNNHYAECQTALAKVELLNLGGKPSMAGKQPAKPSPAGPSSGAVPRNAGITRAPVNEKRPVPGKFGYGTRAPEGRVWKGKKAFYDWAKLTVPPSYEEFKDFFSPPHGPPFPEIETRTKSGAKTLKGTWGQVYKRDVMPKLEEGYPLNTLLQKMWNIDQSESKHPTAYLLRRLMSEVDIVQDKDGYVFLPAFDDVPDEDDQACN